MKRIGTVKGVAAMSVVALGPLLVIIASVRADSGPAEMTLDQVLAAARKNNPGLVVDRAKLAEAETTVEQAWSVLFPTVSAQVKYTHNNAKADSSTFGKLFSGGSAMAGTGGMATGAAGMSGAPIVLQPLDQWDYGVTATQPILAPAAYPAVDAVKANYAASKAGYEVSDANLMVTTARAFLACAAADEARDARRSSIEVARATLKNAESRFSAGTVTKVDVDRAQLAVVRAEQSDREAAFAQEQAYRALGTLIGAQGPFHIQPEIPPAPLPDASNVDMALHLRPEFRQLEAYETSFDAQRRAQAWRWAPSLSAFGNARYFPGYIAFTGEHYAWAVGAQLDWQLYDGGARDAQRHLASAQLTEARAQAEVLRLTIRDDLANGRSQLETKRHGVEAAQQSVNLAKEALELVRVQYEAGTGTQLDLLQAQDAIVEAHLGLAQAHFDAAAADLTFRYAAGTFPPK